ncbi:hypothetical protein NQ315_011677 [Exocentrus adspersus]|uniref:DNA endonuclease RBBP8 n=1 Tax=Exocentrus adspersus TaxID=1586481 RepID=A0AAV8W042_9CUCU|nr:hypothetical protein NQ315_011677 [Exocentrus adspersus]
MYPDAFKQWMALFTDDVAAIWEQERKELKKVTVLLCALQRELRIVQTNVEVQVSNLKQQLKVKDDLEKRDQITKKKSPKTQNKENLSRKELEPHSSDVTPSKPHREGESPDLFRNVDLNAQCSSTDFSIIDLSVSDDDSTVVEGSPTIKKRRKRYQIVRKVPMVKDTAEKDDKPATSANTIRTNLFKTPQSRFDQDVSIIEGTPEVIPKRNKTTSSNVSGFLSKKKGSSGSNKTLTQMFFRTPVTSSKENGTDSDETYYEDNADETKMGITELIHYINKDETGKLINDKSTSDRNIENEVCVGLDTSSQELDEFSKGAIFDEEDVQTSIIEKPKLANIEVEPVVRGKARKQLHGWSCQQCKDFYGNMKLSPDELQKKLDDCSRHRYKYRPREETMPGGCLTVLYCFWDLSIPPEKLE